MTTERLLDGEWLSRQDRDQYDEAQGLTLDMVADYFKRRGWTNGADARYALGSSLRAICALEGMTLQQLLREINQRMRKGCPSDAARLKHDGFWLMRLPYTPPTLVRWSESRKEWQAQQFDCPHTLSEHNAQYCYFWPCDAEGNKVRWPENAAGEML